jgi:transportin-3
MATPQQEQATATVLEALQALYHNPDAQAKKQANDWLQEFQHSVDAWQTCHTLLVNPEAPLEGRMFSAQTLRAKILYDLSQLPRDSLPSLRDSLLGALSPLVQPGAPSGSRAVLTQLALALADLALQMPEWTDVVQGMITQYGNDPNTVTVLLRFLSSLAEESLNPRLPAQPEGSTTIDVLVTGSAEQVIGILSMYIQAPGITSSIQVAIFETMRAWLRAGEFPVMAVAHSPLFTAMFDALGPDDLFDAAVDVICDLVHETQEVQDNQEIVQQILPRIIALRPKLEEYKEDPDRIRGYCRLFCETGESYRDIIKMHPREAFPLVEAIMACTAYPDLDIVPITFQFWWILAGIVNRRSDLARDENFAPYFDVYANLQTTIIGHLHFPADNENQTPQERDEFRTFRHRMGDTLKDCCQVLGAPACLRKSYDMVVAAMSKPSPSWQEIEAPLFSMRSMGAEVDPDDDEVMPHIMEILPKLPDHPRIRYAAILVISRYTQWIDRHPENLAFQLQYISAGFDMKDDEVSAAAAQAMKFMCQDCQRHLVPFLPQLHQFVTTVGEQLDQADMVEVCEAIGFVISSLPSADAAAALQQFCAPLIARVEAVANAPGEAQKVDLQKVADALEQIDSYLTIVRTLDPVPESCYPTAASVYQILDKLLERYAKLYFISERVGSILRRGLTFFPERALEPVVQPVLARLSTAFAQTGYSSYLWITGKIASKFARAAQRPGNEALAQLLVGAFQTVTDSLGKLLTLKDALEIADVMDDYVHCFMAYIDDLPQQTLTSPVLAQAVSHTLAAIMCPAPQTILVCLDTLNMLARRMLDGQYQAQLQPIFAQFAKPILSLVLQGIVQGYPDDGFDQAPLIIQAVVSSVPGAQAESYATEALAGIPGHVLPPGDKTKFIHALHDYQAAPANDKLKAALIGLVRAARKARDRGRQNRKSLGL